MPPPLKMTGNLAANWKTFRSMWTNYETATKLNHEQEEVRVATLLSCVGLEAFELFQSLDFEHEDDRKKMKAVLDRLEKHCVGETNETFERYIFRNRNQDENEPIETYVTVLRALVRSCKFRDLEESLLRDQIVKGIRDDAVRRKLLQTRELNLQKAIDICRASEMSSRQLKEMKPSDDVHKVIESRKPRPAGRSGSERNHHATQRNRDISRQTGRSCKFCGKQHEFKKELCPAYGKFCSKCGKKNHFSALCRTHSENLNCSELQTSDEEEVLLALQRKEEDFPKKLYARLEVGKSIIEFQLDSGASVNVLPEEVYLAEFGQSTHLKPPEATLLMYDKSELPTIGILKAIRNPKNNRRYRLKFYVVAKQKQPILGASACQLMELLKVRSENILEIRKRGFVDHVNKTSVLEEFQDVFQGYGRLEGDLHLEMDQSVTPVRLPLRKLPIAVKNKVQAELERLTRDGIITPVARPTAWISALLVVMKPDGRVRICIDPKPLNKALKRNHYPLPVIDDFVADLKDAKIFSTVDAKDGFWHVSLDEESSYLTTFETPFGKFRWNRLPFGISVAPEEFQRRLNDALTGLEGTVTIADDILIYGCGNTMEEATKDHDQKLIALLLRCWDRGIRLNPDKLKLHLQSVSYMGHVFSADGLKPCSSKIDAIKNMPPPTDKNGIMRFLGMVNYLAKFLPSVSEATASIRSLVRSDSDFRWTPDHDADFENIKHLLQTAPVLRYFNEKKHTIVQCDFSQSGLGACIMQDGAPIAYASRSLNSTEQNYAQIEKETLAIVFAMEKFHNYVYGRTVTIETDHKPLISIFGKALNSAPRRLQRMMLRLQKYSFNLTFKPGSMVVVADTLSRAYPVKDTPSASKHFGEDLVFLTEKSKFERELENNQCLMLLVASDSLKNMILTASLEDPVVIEISRIIQQGWPDEPTSLSPLLREFHTYRDELVVEDNLLFKGERLFVPASVRNEVLQRIHASHIGVNGCLRHAREAVFWPNMTKQIKQIAETCAICNKFQIEQSKEPLESHAVPDKPWQIVGCDLFEYKHNSYLMTADYFSNFFEVDRLNDKKGPEVIRHIKAHMARYGISEVLRTDNGPPFNSSEFRRFCKEYEIKHVTSSPRYPQSNGKVENTIKTAKRLMRLASEDHKDPYLSLLDWRNTPSEGFDLSPSQRMLGRRVRTLLPAKEELFRVPDSERIKRSIVAAHEKQAKYYNKNAHWKPEIPVQSTVRFRMDDSSEWKKGEILQQLPHRSYQIQSEDGTTYRRNRKHVRFSNEPAIILADDSSDLNGRHIDHAPQELVDVGPVPITRTTEQGRPTPDPSSEQNSKPEIRTRSGRICNMPAKYRDFHTTSK